MPSLHELQRSFAASMLTLDAAVYPSVIDEGVPGGERLRIYRNTFRSTLAGVLRLVYPAVSRLTGDDFFTCAAEAFALAHPPLAGDLNRYGDGFDTFLGELDGASSVPYLGDVARFEWALNVAATAPDAATFDVGALALLDPGEQSSLRFVPHPSVTLLVLAFPADHIADAVLAGDDAAMTAIDLVAGPVHLVVWRNAEGVQARRVSRDTHRFLARLYAGAPLQQSLDEDAPPDAAVLLAAELTQGRIAGYRVDAREPVHGRQA